MFCYVVFLKCSENTGVRKVSIVNTPYNYLNKELGVKQSYVFNKKRPKQKAVFNYKS